MGKRRQPWSTFRRVNVAGASLLGAAGGLVIALVHFDDAFSRAWMLSMVVAGVLVLAAGLLAHRVYRRSQLRRRRREALEKERARRKIVRRDEQLRTKERIEAFGRLAYASPLPMSIWKGLDGELVLMNRSFERLFGYSADEIPDLIAWRRRAYPDAEHRRRVVAAWRERFPEPRGDAAGPFEVAVTCRDGSTRIVSIHGTYADGRQLLVFVDQTERRRAEEAARTSGERLAVLVRQSPLGVIEASRDGRIVEWNPAAERIFGFTRTEAVGQHFSLCLAEGRRAAADAWWAGFLGGEVEGYAAWPAVAKDGTNLACELHVGRLTDAQGQLTGAVTFVADVTERKRLARERSRLWQAVEQSPSTVVITDRNGTIEHVNRMFERTTGYTAAEALGKKTSILKSGVHPAAVYEDLWKTISSGGVWHGELCNAKKSGELYWESVSISPARDERGEITHYIAIKEDVTARRQAAADLERAKELAEGASRAKSAFLASMSHEIRTPLNAILGYAQLLERDGAVPEHARRHVEVINRSGEHLLALINDVLEMSKIEAGRTAVEAVPFDVRRIVEDVASMFRLRAGTRGVALEVVVGEGLPARVVADKGKVRQVLINLVGNAVKFTPEGSITLVVTGEPEGGVLVVRVEVRDTGVGIRAEEMGRLFREFEQTESGRRTQSGTGLGLAISRRYARLMGGDVMVASEEGKGSVFRFEFLAGKGEEPAEAEAPRRRVVRVRAKGGAPKVLVVDDEEVGREWLCEVLRSVGFEVREAEDGAKAVEAFRAWGPQAVLMDLRMPVMSGDEATRVIRGERGGGEVVIVALTASGVDGERRQILAEGADLLLAKPVREADLLSALGERLGLEYEGEEPAGRAEAARVGGVGLSAAEVASSVPEAALLEMRAAVRRGDLDAVVARLDGLGGGPGEAGQRLRELAAAFDYESLQRALGIADAGGVGGSGER